LAATLWQTWEISAKEAPNLANDPYSSLAFPFAMVAAALVEAYRIAPEDQARFRARITFLQRNGLFGEQPGSGSRMGYRPDHMHKLIFCFELAAFNVTPTVQLKLVEEFWDARIRTIFKEAEQAAMHDPSVKDIALLLVGVDFMVGAWAGAVPNINYAHLDKVKEEHLMTALFPSVLADAPLPARVMMVNLSDRLRKFHGALSRLNMPLLFAPAAGFPQFGSPHKPNTQAKRRRVKKAPRRRGR
jgi:hypothetical protein